ncbi:MAG: DNA recombination protein RmuC [Rickettsiales bacterium]|jgi:DNA recombination protein RmuC|nr:DNA recombination protein RmuC [Rickettsiales bacterium]
MIVYLIIGILSGLIIGFGIGFAFKKYENKSDNVDDKMLKFFQNISNSVIKEQSKYFDEKGRESINNLLNPFAIQMTEFKNRIEIIHKDNMQTRGAFDEQMRHLFDSQRKMSEDANNLTQALQGNSKMQGNWGEVQLKNLLDITGLQEGIDYVLQEQIKTEDGEKIIPDVIVRLPDNRQIVIDSKVSLVDYVRYMNEADEVLRTDYLKSHLRSVKNHIAELSAKSYADSLRANSIDFVLMFIPIEHAYIAALQADNSIYENAYKSKVAITTPSSLVPILRTIENLWRVSKGVENAEQIAVMGGKLYDKLSGFVENFQKVDDGLNKAKSAYSDAFNQLSNGRGNAISIAQNLKKLGAKVSKELPENLDDISELIELKDNDE